MSPHQNRGEHIVFGVEPLGVSIGICVMLSSVHKMCSKEPSCAKKHFKDGSL